MIQAIPPVPMVESSAVRDWPMVQVGDLFDIQQGKALSPAARTADKRYPFLRTANVLWNRIDTTTVDSMGMSEDDRSRLELRPGDLLLCEGGEIGRAAVWHGELDKCYYQNHLHRLRPKGNSDPEFYQYWFRFAFTLSDLYQGAGTRTTIANLSRGSLSRLMVPAPSIGDQRRIAGTLSTIFKAIVAGETLSDRVLSAKASVVHHQFERVLRKAPRASLEDVVSAPVCYGILKPGPHDPDGVPCVHVTDYVAGSLDPTHLRRTSRTLHMEFARSSLRAGDVLVAIRGTNGPVVQVPEALDGANISRDSARLRVRDGINSRYVLWYLRTEEAQRFISGSVTGVAVRGVNIATLRKLPIPLPPEQEQNQIARVCDICERWSRATADKAVALRSLFEAALVELMEPGNGARS